MFTDSGEEEPKEWDYMCPQFCDFNAKETTDQLKEMDNFFEVDHELEEQKSFYGDQQLIASQMTPEVQPKPQMNSITKGIKVSNEGKDEFKYETPPQNKENLEDDNDTEVFYSTKKYLSVERKYKLRSTPMRTLQYNGNTPLRETRLSSMKKKNKRSDVKKFGEESLMTMEPLIDALPVIPDKEDIPTIPSTIPETQVITEQNNEIQVEVEDNVKTDQQNQPLIEEEVIPNEEENDVFQSENENHLPTEPVTDSVPNKRESYVISKVVKSVTLVSPDISPAVGSPKSSKANKSNKKIRFSNTQRRRGTPIRRSILSTSRKITSQSIVSRLYSSVKKPVESQYKSMAQLLREFETQPRGRSLDRAGSSQRSRSSSVSSLTQPKSPKFHSVRRHRTTPRQTEDIIASQIKKYSFKANPIRKKLFDANFASGIPRVKSSKEPTKAVPMSFMTEKRIEMRSTKQVTDHKSGEPSHFKANPMPAFKNPHIFQHKSEKKTSFKPFSFDDRIQQLVTKKRSQSESNVPKDIQNRFKF